MNWEPQQEVTIMFEGKPSRAGKIGRVDSARVEVWSDAGIDEFYPDGSPAGDSRSDRANKICLGIHIRPMTEEDRAYLEKKSLIDRLSSHYWNNDSLEVLRAVGIVLCYGKDFADRVSKLEDEMIDEIFACPMDR